MIKRRLKHLVIINERALPETTDPDFEFRYLDIGAVGHGELIEEPEHVTFASAPNRARRLVRPGDVIISTVRTYLRAVWPARGEIDDLVVSTGFAVLTPGPDIGSRYLGWLAQSDVVIEEVVARSIGVSYPAINPSEIGDLHVPLPPMRTQTAIADYLDTETTRIDALIAKKRRMIELMDERTASIIAASAPTDGRTVRLGSVARIQTGLTLDAGRELAGSSVSLPYLRVANVQDGSLDLDELKDVSVPRALADRCSLRPGDVLMTEGGDPDKLGRGTVWPGIVEPCLHQNHVFAVRPNLAVLLPEFLALLTRTPYARCYFEKTAAKTTGIASTSTTKIASLRIPLPDRPDQQRIVAATDRRLGVITATTGAVVRQIELLGERRQALITAAVTGDLDIPGVAA